MEKLERVICKIISKEINAQNRDIDWIKVKLAVNLYLKFYSMSNN